MHLTIEELYTFKTKYEIEIEELNRKKVVVDELIRFVEAKQPTGESEDDCDNTEPVVVVEETATDGEF